MLGLCSTGMWLPPHCALLRLLWSQTMPDGTNRRGDINVLLLGDPSTAKSQFLKFASKVVSGAAALLSYCCPGMQVVACDGEPPQPKHQPVQPGRMMHVFYRWAAACLHFSCGS